MNNKILALLVIFSLIMCQANLLAEERRGAELAVQKLDGQRIEGELIAIKQNSLLLLSSAGTDVSVDIKDINIIIIVKKSKALIGALGGFLIGGVVGGYIARGREDESELEWAFRVIYAVPIMILGCGALGAILGVFFGSALGADETIRVARRSDAEKKDVLEKLRRRARIKNAY